MKTLITISLILSLSIPASITFSQFGWQKIYSDDTAMGIVSTKSIKITGNNAKQLYIIRGVNFNPNGNPNNSGKSLKLNRMNNSWYQPAGGFLNANWCFCTCTFTCNPPRFVCNRVLRFAVSPADTHMIFKNLFGGCGCDAGDVVLFTLNGGGSSTNLPQFGNDFMGQLNFGIDIDPVNDNIIYLGYSIISTQHKCVFKSTNRGATWAAVDTNSNFSQGLIKVNPLKRNYIYTNSFSGLMLSTTSGTDFVSVNCPALGDIAVNYSDSVLFGLTSSGIYKSVNHGLNWIQVLAGNSFRSVEVSPDNPNLVYAGTIMGLWRSTNGGTSWLLYNDSFNPSKNVIGISKDEASGDTVYAVTTDAVYKVWGSWLGVTTLSTNIPEKFRLYQNYPNPFNPTTSLTIDIGKSGNINLKIYDLTGKEIDVLINRYLDAGTYRFDYYPSSLSSGVYFVSLQSEGKQLSSIKLVFSK